MWVRIRGPGRRMHTCSTRFSQPRRPAFGVAARPRAVICRRRDATPRVVSVGQKILHLDRLNPPKGRTLTHITRIAAQGSGGIRFVTTSTAYKIDQGNMPLTCEFDMAPVTSPTFRVSIPSALLRSAKGGTSPQRAGILWTNWHQGSPGNRQQAGAAGAPFLNRQWPRRLDWAHRARRKSGHGGKTLSYPVYLDVAGSVVSLLSLLRCAKPK